MQQLPGNDAFRWILKTGWKGLCPRCGKGHMFKSWLKVADTCDVCGLSYRFAAPDDGPAFFSLCIVAFPLAFIVVGLIVFGFTAAITLTSWSGVRIAVAWRAAQPSTGSPSRLPACRAASTCYRNIRNRTNR